MFQFPLIGLIDRQLIPFDKFLLNFQYIKGQVCIIFLNNLIFLQIGVVSYRKVYIINL